MAKHIAKKPGSAMIGAAGEHYVLFRLLSQGVLAGLAPQGTKDVDILAMSPDEEIACRVQVKTSVKKTNWPMKPKHKTLVKSDLVYAFVDLSGQHPTTYLMPSYVVADALTQAHKLWLETPGKGVKKVKKKDSGFLLLSDPFGVAPVDYPAGWTKQWQERWDLVSGSAPSAV